MADLIKVMETLKKQEEELKKKHPPINDGEEKTKIEEKPDGKEEKIEFSKNIKDDGAQIEEKEDTKPKPSYFNIDKTAEIFGQSEEDIGKEFKEFKALKLFRRFDADLTEIKDLQTLEKKIDESIKFGFGNIVVNPKMIKYAKNILKGKKIGVFSAVCFPYGEEIFGVKRYASKKAFESGADGVYLPVGVADLKSGKLEQVKKEFSKIVKKHRKKKVFALLEVGELDFSTVEKVVKILLKIKVAGIVSGSGFSENGKCFQGASDLHSLSGGKKSVIACSTTKKSREVVSLFTVADRIFIKNAPTVARELKTNLEF